MDATDAKPERELGPLPAQPGVQYHLGGHPEAILADADLVVVSPGMPMAHPFLDAARARGIAVIGEIELASRLLGGLTIGITGTNGKSTTTALIAHLLQKTGREAIACGNFGIPWISFATAAQTREPSPTRVWVIELSSFQLEGIKRFSPDTALMLNVTPDHMDRYEKCFDKYAAAKARIFENQRPAQIAVINADDAASRRMRPRSRRLEFSRTSRPEYGTWITEGRIFSRLYRQDARFLAERSWLALPGAHNTENLLAALASVAPFGLDPEGIREALVTFVGLPHRMVIVRLRAGVAFINDSKGTNVDATLKSLEGFPDGSVHLILGGKGKESDFTLLKPLVAKKARAVYGIGVSSPEILKAIDNAVECHACETLARAVSQAARLGKPGDTVLLSPACASFDQFKNFEHRGEEFERLVKELPETSNG